MYKQVLALLTVAGMTAFASTASRADVILPYATGFETDAVNTVPAGWNPPVQPSTSGAIEVVDGSSTGGSGANQHVFQFKGVGPSYWDYADFAEITDQKVVVEFKVKLGIGTNGTDVKFLGRGSGGQNSYIRLRAGTQMAFSYYDTSFHDLLTGVVQGDWYSVKQTLDLTNKTFDITIDNLDNASPAQHVEMTGLAYSSLSGGPVNNINSWGVSRVSGGDVDFQVDDVAIHVVVPEPASLGLLSIGALLMAGQRHTR